jgi:hypothetical protein
MSLLVTQDQVPDGGLACQLNRTQSLGSKPPAHTINWMSIKSLSLRKLQLATDEILDVLLLKLKLYVLIASLCRWQVCWSNQQWATFTMALYQGSKPTDEHYDHRLLAVLKCLAQKYVPSLTEPVVAM